MDQSASLTGVFLGEGTLLVRCAERFAAAGHRVVAVVSAEPRVRAWAAERAVPAPQPGADLAAVLGGFAFDYLFSVANMRVVPEGALALARRGAINFHDALLPRYAGAYATSWAIVNEETTHGVTWHEMLARVDAGRILKQRAVAVAADETAVSLNAKCYEAGVESFAELVGELATGTATYTDPRLAERSYFPLYRRPEGAAVLRWNRPAAALSALARALDFGPAVNPLGVPKIDLGHAVLLAPRVEVLPTAVGAAAEVGPGTVLRLEGDAIVVSTGTLDVRLPELLTTDGRPLTRAELAEWGVVPGAVLAPRGAPAGATQRTTAETTAAPAGVA